MYQFALFSKNGLISRFLTSELCALAREVGVSIKPGRKPGSDDRFFSLAREAGVSIKPGAQAPGSERYLFCSPWNGRQRSVARSAGLNGLLKEILGLAPQALCLRPLRGLEAKQNISW